MVMPIHVPDDAPFSPEQREWLSQFLGKMLSGASAPAVASGPSIPVTILVGSQTGNAENTAKKLAKNMSKMNFEPKVIDMGAYDKSKLASEKNLLVITSTYGDGEPPDNAAELHGYLMNGSAPKLDGVKFSVLALGDREYPDFCKCGIEFDTRLGELGGERVFNRIDCDVDYDKEFKLWCDGVIAAFGGGAAASVAVAEADEETGYSKKNPFSADIRINRNLNAPKSERETHHIEIALDGSGLEYEVGDALGVYPANDASVVDEILAAMPFNVNDSVPLPDGGEASLRDALIYYYDIRSINKAIVEKWQTRSGSPFLRSLVEADKKDEYDNYCWGRELIDLILEHPADFSDGEDFVGFLRKLQPRLYSISSSPKAHPGEVHLTIAIVRYESFGRKRGGVCSSWFSDRSKDQKARVFVHANKAFRPPSNGDTPLIMIGPGTGIAPFRAFLEERAAVGAKGSNWLFFGNPHAATDFLYQDELEAMQKSGVLTKLDTAFSRDQKQKIYVQDKMIESGVELWKWLEQGSYVAVCGDASRMAKDVDNALHKVIEVHGGKTPEQAAEYVSQLKKDKRYVRDVY